MSPRYLDQLDKERRKIFFSLKGLKKDFVLAGGTAIMLQIGHRLSYDFDLFTHNPIGDIVIKKIKKVFGGELTIEERSEELVFTRTKSNIDIHFVQHPFKELKKPVETSSIKISHLDDLASNKAYTIGRRPVWRDYVDIFLLLKWNYYNLPSIMSLAEKKFKNEFNSKLFLEQLVYFEDLRVVETMFLKERYSEKQIKSFLENQVKDYLKKYLS